MAQRCGAWMLVAGVAALSGCAGEDSIQLPVAVAADTSPFQYPVALWDQNIKGETIVVVHVTSEGAVDSASVYRSSGYPEFDSAAIRGVWRLRFIPGRQGDRNVGMKVKLPVRFDRDSAAVTTGPGQPLGDSAAAGR